MKTELDVLLVAALFGGIGFFLGFGLSPECAKAAEQVLRSKDGVTRLYNTPCTVASVLERFPTHRAELKQGELTLDGRKIAACWVVGSQFVFLIDEDGDLSRVPRVDFEVAP